MWRVLLSPLSPDHIAHADNMPSPSRGFCVGGGGVKLTAKVGIELFIKA